MQAINVRSPLMWEAIFTALSRIDGCNVIDLGAGYGDLSLRFARAGARVIAVENDPLVLATLRERVGDSGYAGNVTVLEGNIEDYDLPIWHADDTDIFVITSVLPYLSDPDKLLWHMSTGARMSIIECQYSGDGPGFANIGDDHDMRLWLMRFWAAVSKIGETHLNIRPASRSIWLCETIREYS